jgi:hypothetical protein
MSAYDEYDSPRSEYMNMPNRMMIFMVMISFGQLAQADVPELAVKRQKIDLPNTVKPAVAEELDAEAYVLSEKNGSTTQTLWFRKAVPMIATADQIKNGLTYREIPDGTLIGVIRFDRPFVDFRKQDVPAGVYSVRFAVQPDTGDHMGTAPHPEFVLLTPIDKDPMPDAIETKKLIEQSATITEGDHPSVMLLFPNYAKEEEAKIVANDGNILVLKLRRKIEADGVVSSLGFAFVVHGSSKSR